MEASNSFESNWPAASISCPNCKHTISYYDRRKSAFFACEQCGTFFERGENETSVLRTFLEEDREPPCFPLGTTGIIDGKEYILVGFMTKKEEQEEVYWDEYAFYSPGEQWYMMLAEYDGQWMIIKRSDSQAIEVTQAPDGKEYAYDNGWPFELYLSYKFTIIDAAGEFDWNILSDEELVTYEYVSAPHILVNEFRDNKSSWFRATYISPRKLIKGFNIAPEMLPPRSWPAPFTPATFYPRWKPLLQFTGILLALLVLVNAIVMMAKPQKVVFAGSFTCETDTSSWGGCKSIVTPPFTVNGPAPVFIGLGSYQLENNWMEVSMELVNDNNGKVYELDKTLEYYHGYDDGESWSEGDREKNALISHVPSGTYHLNIHPATENKEGIGPATLDIKVSQNDFLSLNFWLLFLLITVYPLIQWIRKYAYENSKWFAKDYGTLNKE